MTSCEKCGSEFTPRHANRAGRFCSSACYHASGRPNRKEVTTGTRMHRVPGHPLAPPSGTVAECRLVLYEKIGPGPHPCEWCKRLLDWKPGQWTEPDALVADHLDWNIHNNDPANLVPSCRFCNAHRVKGGGRAPIRDDEPFITRPNGVRARATGRECLECGAHFLAALTQVNSGKGLYCSRSCARRADARKRKARQPSSPSA